MPARKRSARRVREPALPARRDSALLDVHAAALMRATGSPEAGAGIEPALAQRVDPRRR